DQHSSYIRRLTLLNVDDRLVRDGFDEPVTQHVERRSKRTVLTRLQALHNVRTDRLIVDQRPPGMVDEHSIHKSPGPSLQRVTATPRHRNVMAIAATRVIKDRAQAVLYLFYFIERRAEIVERLLTNVAICFIVESGGRFPALHAGWNTGVRRGPR